MLNQILRKMATNIIEILKPGKQKIFHYLALLFMVICVFVNIIFTITFYKASSKQAMNDIV